MAATRVVVVSDSHLSDTTPEAIANWDAVVDHIESDPPRYVIHAGDITADGAVHPRDLMLAWQQLARIDIPFQAIPGNHDIGDNPHGGHRLGADGDHQVLVTPERLTRYRAVLGPDQWTVDVPGWRLIGVNALLFGSGLEEEADQWRWLGSILRSGRGHRVVLFLHKPLVASPTRPDDANPGRYVVPRARQRLLELLTAGPAVVVSGHVHQFCRHHRFGIDHVWVPTTWAMFPDRIQPRHGEKVCGVVELVLGSDGSKHVTLRRPAGISQQFLSHI